MPLVCDSGASIASYFPNGLISQGRENLCRSEKPDWDVNPDLTLSPRSELEDQREEIFTTFSSKKTA